MITSMFAVPAIALQTNFHSPENLRNLGSMPKTAAPCFVELEAYDAFLVKSFGEC